MVKNLKTKIMNKSKLTTVTQFLMLVIIAGLGFSSCAYDDFVENEFDFTSVYLPYQQIDRTFIMGEGMRIGVGAVLGGRLDNTEDVEITFSLQDDLVNDAGLTVLPTSHYQLVDADGNPANNKITIPAGSSQGFVYVKADSINFLGDTESLGNKYALGFQLENVVKADSILSNLKSTMITFTYINQLYGKYIQKGSFVKEDGASSETLTYSGVITDEIEFTMAAPKTFVYNGLAEFRGGTQKMHVILADDNTITLESIAGSVAIIDDGGSIYNPDTREITLNYSFDYNGANYKASDVLEFRNRIVDGVNQTEI
ncbi:hypothetical protein BTO15_05105 [Polaribacter sejongensis]|uniref:DUF1735 domain-containing protein n=2 Tax=Polaribacter sejongensis TaxID=985043 RepID=A0ABN5F3I4_9FLAO|nr:hypothetical protein BTO15_05105 [Polaribacter sejongensis]